MTDPELEALLGAPDSDRVERKASLSDRSAIRRDICAFANDLPGHGVPGILVIGAHDDGSPSGLPITDELIQNIGNMKSNGSIAPFPSMTVETRVLRGSPMLVVMVHPSSLPPVRYEGRVWVRVGSVRSLATPEDERRLVEKRRFKNLPPDLHTVDSATLRDLDLAMFRDTYLPSSVAQAVLEENRRTLEEQLAALRLVESAGNPVPTVCGVLVLGRDPRSVLPCAYVQFVRFDGTGLADPVKDTADWSLPIRPLTLEIEAKLRSHNSTAIDVNSGVTETRRPEYPLAALRQLVHNAILHRTYEGTNSPVRIHWFTDRIEIMSPGGPYGRVSARTFGDPSLADYRNPSLAEAMKNLGLVQRFGIGLQVVREEMQRNGNPPAEWVVNEGYVLAIVRKGP